MADTKIEWATKTWNPTTGCDRVSPGCDNCYAMTLAPRLKAMELANGTAAPKYQRDGDPRTSGPGFGVSMHPGALMVPLRWRKPQRVFVNSMSDLFHDEISDEFIAQVFAVMAVTPHHTYQVLTKRHRRMRSLLSSPEFYRAVRSALRTVHGLSEVDAFGTARFPLSNLWLGVSVENQKWADIRIPALMQTPAAVRFLSCEPLLGPVTLTHLHTHCPEHDFDGGFCTGPCPYRRGPDWVIVGGESGRDSARRKIQPMHPAWARSLRDQCTGAGIPFLFKQFGEYAPAPWKVTREEAELGATHAVRYAGDFLKLDHQPWSAERSASAPDHWAGIRRVGKHRAGRELDGRTWDEYPGGES